MLIPRILQGRQTVGLFALVAFLLVAGSLGATDFAALQQRAAGDDPEAWFQLGQCYRLGSGTTRDLSLGEKWLRQAADRGHTDAEYALGWMLCYRNTDGEIEIALTGEGVDWLRKAADKKHVRALNRLGFLHEIGDAKVASPPVALQYYLQAAELGDASSQLDAAELLLHASPFNNQGVEKNAPEAVKWLKKAADQGLVKAQVRLGELYKDGKDVPLDAAEAKSWLEKAAATPHEKPDSTIIDACTSLARMYEPGGPLPLDEVEAARWMLRAAEEGDPSAQCSLAKKHLEGKGVPADPVEAYVWYALAIERGFKHALIQREEIAEKLSTMQLIKAKAILTARSRAIPGIPKK